MNQITKLRNRHLIPTVGHSKPSIHHNIRSKLTNIKNSNRFSNSTKNKSRLNNKNFNKLEANRIFKEKESNELTLMDSNDSLSSILCQKYV